MIDIPLGKALVPEEEKGFWKDCRNCALLKMQCQQSVACRYNDRKDGKNVIFKLVDYPYVSTKNEFREALDNYAKYAEEEDRK